MISDGFQSTNIPVQVTYGAAVGLYIGISLFFNSLGQMVENEVQTLAYQFSNFSFSVDLFLCNDTYSLKHYHAKANLTI